MKRSLFFLHRWLGIALCLFFLIWFPSGIGIMYWGYPDVTAADRLERAAPLDASQVSLAPAEAFARLGDPEPPRAVRLATFDERPVYRFDTRLGERLVFADTGEERGEISTLTVRRIASAWTGQPSQDSVAERVDDVDQWTVQQNLRDLRPLWKFSWPNGEQVYVSQALGEVVQYTTTGSRLGAYLGPIPHWLYFTPLRKNGPEWSRLVIWSSGIGTVGAILGLIVGAWRYSPSRRYRYDGAPTRIPYRGQKRWHMVLGLVFGVATVTWAFSGMLSMDPFPRGGGAGQRRAPRPNVAGALRARPDLAAFAARPPASALAQLRGAEVKQLELATVVGEPVYLATLDRHTTRVVPVSGEPRDGFDRARLSDAIEAAAAPRMVDVTLLEQYDRYYLDRRRERPLPVLLARVDDGEGSRYYVDPKTARVVGSYSSRNWVNRWLYSGLHSLNFPWLYNYRPLWDIVVIAFMLGGTALSVTSLVLAWRVLGRKLQAIAARPSRSGDRVSDGLVELP